MALKDTLSPQDNMHFFGLEPLQQSGTIVLTLSYEAENPEAKPGHINFLILTKEGLRRYLAGAELSDISIASGAVDEFAPDSNRLKAAFRDSVEDTYFVLVYNNSGDSADYTLIARGAILVGQPSESAPIVNPVADERTDETVSSADEEPTAVVNLLPTPTPRRSRTPTRIPTATPTRIPTATPTQIPTRVPVVANRVTSITTPTNVPPPIPPSPTVDRFAFDPISPVQPIFRSTPTPVQRVLASTLTPTSTSIPTRPVEIPKYIDAEQLTGLLDERFERHYITLTPAQRDGEIYLFLNYDPIDQPQLDQHLNFWVLDDDGLRRIINGDELRVHGIATGFRPQFSANPGGELEAQFTASGEDPYTLIIYNDTNIPATYTISASGGTLTDIDAQTNESKKGLSYATSSDINPSANSPTQGAIPLVGNQQAPVAAAVANEANTPGGGEVETARIETTVVRGTQLRGELTTLYQQHFLGLYPEIPNGRVVLTMDYDPRDQQALREKLNFLVLTEDGIRRVIAGGNPFDLDIAAGAFIDLGADRDFLQASFNASGLGKYTIIVYNNSLIPGSYALHVEGGLLEDEAGQTTAGN
ncbi:MAG: hypothetical protein AAF639_06940 [Chloroflexota bacterium]